MQLASGAVGRSFKLHSGRSEVPNGRRGESRCLRDFATEAIRCPCYASMCRDDPSADLKTAVKNAVTVRISVLLHSRSAISNKAGVNHHSITHETHLALMLKPSSNPHLATGNRCSKTLHKRKQSVPHTACSNIQLPTEHSIAPLRQDLQSEFRQCSHIGFWLRAPNLLVCHSLHILSGARPPCTHQFTARPAA